jgi:thiosulfate/3-mercaptopyruvate sulfurtransferase
MERRRASGFGKRQFTAVKVWGEDKGIRPIARLIGLLLLTIIVWPSFLAAQSRNPVKSEMLVSTDWLATHLHDSKLIVLCIVDDERFYSSGHIPGARMIRVSQIVTVRDGIPNELPSARDLQGVFENAGVRNDSRIVLYGERSGLLAARGYFTLDYIGHADRAALLDGGIEKWRGERREESTIVPAPDIGKLGIRTNPKIAVSLAKMSKYSRARSAVLMDARPKAEYTGDKLSEDVSKAGHIPGAVGLYWRGLLQDDSIPELKSAVDLERLFRSSGAVPGKEIITYCRTGMQSSFSYFVAKYLGYKVRMYDGSFYEWSRSSLPVEH